MSYAREFRRMLWERDGRCCVLCSQPVELEAMAIDHKKPRARGGTDEWENLQTTHPRCNSRKGLGPEYAKTAGRMSPQTLTPGQLTAARRAMRLTQVALAQLLGIHPTVLNRWEKGIAKSPPYLHLALAAILDDVSTDWIYSAELTED